MLERITKRVIKGYDMRQKFFLILARKCLIVKHVLAQFQ
jgi:hypothetical protein